MTPSPRWLARLVLGLVLGSLAVGPVSSQPSTRGHGAEAHDMELVGHDDLQGRIYVPATTERTAERCVTTDGARSCKVAIQTNHVEVDERGLVHLADRANSGLHTVRLTGEASRIAGGN